MKKVLMIVFTIMIMLTGCWYDPQRDLKEMKETSLEESKEFFVANKDSFEKVHSALIEIDESYIGMDESETYTIIEVEGKLLIKFLDGEKPIDRVFEKPVVEALNSLFYAQSGKRMTMIVSMATFIVEIDNLVALIIRKVDDVEELNMYSIQIEAYIENLIDDWYVVVYCHPPI